MEPTRSDSENQRGPANQALSRRNALKTLAVATGAAALSTLPGRWEKPVVEVGVLPAHAQASPTATLVAGETPLPSSTSTATLTATPTPTSTATPTATPTPGILGNEFALMGTVSDGTQIVVLPTANTNLPNPAQNTVPGLPAGAAPHGVAYFGDTGGLVSDFRNSRVFIVDLQTSTLVDTITPTTYDGSGTIAVAPGSGYALACDESNNLNVIQAPFSASSTITTVALSGSIRGYETQAIVFNAAGRAFVYHTQGISVIDPPYSTISFTIPVAFNNTGGAIAISPGGNTLLITDWQTSNVYIFHAPFSASSTPEILAVSTKLPPLDLTTTGSSVSPAGPALNNGQQLAVGFVGIAITPDGSKALVCSSTISEPRVYAISAPFSSASTVEQIPLPAALTSGPGFEDIGISPDGKLAIITGGSVLGAPAAFIQSPFTAAGATVFAVNITGGGRGAGAVRFHP